MSQGVRTQGSPLTGQEIALALDYFKSHRDGVSL